MSLPSSENHGDRSGVECFQTTHWSAVLAAGQSASPGATESLENLCRSYWYPLYVYTRRRGYPVEDAKDLTQAFFATFLRKEYLAHADPRKGKFRCFLLTALNHFLANDWRRSQALRRGGGRPVLSLDDTAEVRYAAEPAADLPPDKAFERRWALDLFEQALTRLHDQYAAADKHHLFRTLKPFLSREPDQGDYARVAAELGLSSGAVAVTVHRLRYRYRELVRDEIAQTVSNPAEVEEELHALLSALG